MKGSEYDNKVLQASRNGDLSTAECLHLQAIRAKEADLGTTVPPQCDWRVVSVVSVAIRNVKGDLFDVAISRNLAQRQCSKVKEMAFDSFEGIDSIEAQIRSLAVILSNIVLIFLLFQFTRSRVLNHSRSDVHEARVLQDISPSSILLFSLFTTSSDPPSCKTHASADDLVLRPVR